MKGAYDDYTIKNEKELKSFNDWRADRERLYPQFKFWSLTLKLELSVLSFVRSIIRMGNLDYTKNLSKTYCHGFLP